MQTLLQNLNTKEDKQKLEEEAAILEIDRNIGEKDSRELKIEIKMNDENDKIIKYFNQLKFYMQISPLSVIKSKIINKYFCT